MGKTLPNKETNSIIEISKNVNCDAYGKVDMIKIPYEDTIVIESVHIHLEEDHICCWVPKDMNIYKDTLYLEIKHVR